MPINKTKTIKPDTLLSTIESVEKFFNPIREDDQKAFDFSGTVGSSAKNLQTLRNRVHFIATFASRRGIINQDLVATIGTDVKTQTLRIGSASAEESEGPDKEIVLTARSRSNEKVLFKGVDSIHQHFMKVAKQIKENAEIILQTDPSNPELREKILASPFYAARDPEEWQPARIEDTAQPA